MEKQEAATFQPIQISPELIEKMNAKDDLMASLEKQAEEAHKAFWGDVFNAHPQLDSDEGFALDTTYKEQGVVMLKKADERKSCIQNLLREVLSKKDQ